MPIIKRQNRSDGMHLHEGDKVRVVSLLSDDARSHDDAVSRVQHLRRIREKVE